MKPPPFRYEDPDTVEQVLALLAEHGEHAAVLAGGQSLVPQLNLRARRPAVVVDLRRVAGLDTVTPAAPPPVGGTVTIGARTTLRALLAHPVVAVPGLEQAIRKVAFPEVRNRSTIGGNVAQAEPAGEVVTTLVGLGATAELVRRDGRRRVPVGDLVVGPWRTSIAADELLVAIHLEVPPGVGAWREQARLGDDFPVVGAHVRTHVVAGEVVDAAVAVGGAGPVPTRLPEVERLLVGRAPGPELAAALDVAVTEAVEPEGDRTASAAYRRALAGTLARRAAVASWAPTSAPAGADDRTERAA